ncbi:MAG: hypothetical protein KC656_02125, partial [Myxococcales bacterium]|nr:hypothetical protein [Myxococcales bacterium]
MILMFASALAASDSAETPTLTLDITLDAGVVFDCSLTGLSGTILNGAGQNDTYTLPPALSWRQAPFDQNDTHTVFDGSDWLVG